MSFTTVTAPTVYPITTAEAKAQARVEHSDDDSLIDAYIVAATDYVEKMTGKHYAQRTIDYKLSAFPTGGKSIEIPLSPVQSITSITYTDRSASPVVQTLSSSVYGLDSGIQKPLVYLQYGQSWPGHTVEHNGITLRLVTGYAPSGSPQDYQADIPGAVKIAIRLIVADLYEHREANLDVQTYRNDAVRMLLDPFRVYHL